MRLTIDREGSKIIMRDEDTKEIAILDSQEQAVSNFASWIYAGHLSGKPTEKKDNCQYGEIKLEKIHTHSTLIKGRYRERHSEPKITTKRKK